MTTRKGVEWVTHPLFFKDLVNSYLWTFFLQVLSFLNVHFSDLEKNNQNVFLFLNSQMLIRWNFRKKFFLNQYVKTLFF